MSRCTDINICIPQYLFPSTAPARCARMFDDDVHMSSVHNPGAGCPIRRPSDLSAPHICTRSSHCPGLAQQSTSALQLPPLHILSLARPRQRRRKRLDAQRTSIQAAQLTHIPVKRQDVFNSLRASRWPPLSKQGRLLYDRDAKLSTRLCPLSLHYSQIF